MPRSGKEIGEILPNCGGKIRSFTRGWSQRWLEACDALDGFKLLEFLTGKSFGCFKLPHEMTILPCIAFCVFEFIMVQNRENLRFCNLKTEATNTSMGILEFICVIRARICCLSSSTNTEAGADKAQKIDLWAISLRPTYRRANKQCAPVGSKFCNRLWTHKHMKHHGTSHYDSGHSNCGDTVVTHVSQMFQTVPHHLSFRPLIAGRHGRKWRESLHVIGGLGDLFQRLDRLQLGWRPIWTR